MIENKKIILVIEDEKPLLDAIKMKLEKNNFKVLTTRTIEEAKKHVADLQKIDAIWLDHYLLGKENGLDFLVWCKQEGNVKCKEVPIFVVSNTASPEKVAAYNKLGVRKYFIKANHRIDDIVCALNKEIADNLVCKI